MGGKYTPLHGVTLSLVGGGGPRHLVMQRRYLNIPLLILLLLYPPIDPPPPPLRCSPVRLSAAVRVRVESRYFSMAAMPLRNLCPPFTSPPSLLLQYRVLVNAEALQYEPQMIKPLTAMVLVHQLQERLGAEEGRYGPSDASAVASS